MSQLVAWGGTNRIVSSIAPSQNGFPFLPHKKGVRKGLQKRSLCCKKGNHVTNREFKIKKTLNLRIETCLINSDTDFHGEETKMRETENPSPNRLI